MNPSATAPPNPAPVDNDLAEHLMERLECDRFGGPDVVHLSTFALAGPQADEGRVRVKAAPINPIDWKTRSGDTKMMAGSKFPRAMGTDFAGNVEAVGSKVTRLKPDAVVGSVCLARPAAFSSARRGIEVRVWRAPQEAASATARAPPNRSANALFRIVRHDRTTSGIAHVTHLSGNKGDGVAVDPGRCVGV